MNRNKVFSFFFLIVLVSMSAEVQGRSEIFDNDGTHWMGESAAFKSGFVTGYIAGTGLMDNELASPFRGLKGKAEYQKASHFIRALCDGTIDRAESLAFFDITVGQISDGLDTFYADFSTRKIKVIDALYIVRMQIKGSPPELIAAQVRYLKMLPISEQDSDAALKRIQAYDDWAKALNAGQISGDDLLKGGLFISKDGEFHWLFCYGAYR